MNTNNNDNNDNNKNKNKNNEINNKNNNFNLYNFDFQNKIIDNNKYEERLEKIKEERRKLKIKDDPVCMVSAGGPCCSSEIFLTIADFFYKYIDDPNVKNILDESGLFLGINLAVIGLYEKALYGDNYPLTFKENDTIGNKIIIKTFYDTFKDDIKKYDDNRNSKDKLINKIEEILYSPDEDFPELQSINDSKKNPNKLTEIKNELINFLKKDTISDEDKIQEISDKIEILEQGNIDYADKKKEKYESGNSSIKFYVKEVFINILCNFLATSNSGATIFDAIGGINQFMDMLKSGAAAGGFIVFIYIIVVIILIICGIFGIY